MAIVPGSIPKIIFAFFINGVNIFITLLFEVTLCIEQKYQNINQMGDCYIAGSFSFLFFVQKN